MRQGNRLIDAATDGDLTTVQAMIAAGADVNFKDFFKIDALTWAATNGHKDIVAYLLSLPGIDVKSLNKGGTTALMAACRKGHLDIVNMLLAHPDTDANQLGKFGGTALMNAAGFGHAAIVERLLQIKGISLAATYTDKKFSPATIARHNGHTAIADMIEAHMPPATPVQRTKPPSP